MARVLGRDKIVALIDLLEGQLIESLGPKSLPSLLVLLRLVCLEETSVHELHCDALCVVARILNALMVRALLKWKLLLEVSFAVFKHALDQLLASLVGRLDDTFQILELLALSYCRVEAVLELALASIVADLPSHVLACNACFCAQQGRFSIRQICLLRSLSKQLLINLR